MDSAGQQVDYFHDDRWQEIKTLIKIQEFKKLLQESKYNEGKAKFLIQGLTAGFSLGYDRPTNKCDTSDNLPLNNLGTKTDVWNKVMKEVKVGRYSGPFSWEHIPFEHFIQSPIGLVPKAGNKTRLIFHLSYDFKSGTSVNGNTPEDICHVKYKDLDHAIDVCIKLLRKHGRNCTLFFAKTDLESAFRIIPILVTHRRWLLMKAQDPITRITYYFIDKCLTFGASISCAVFQKFSDALGHIAEYLLSIEDILTNYLDDFLFIAITSDACDYMVNTFLVLCKRIGCPVSEHKTE